MTTMISKEAVKTDIRRVARVVGSAPSRDQYRAKGNFSSWLAEARFGTWTKALRAARVNN